MFLVIPVIILSKLGDEFANSSINQILFAGLFGGLGALLGGGLLQLVKTKTTIVKTVSVIILTVFCATTLIVTNKLNKPTFLTCEICGYKGITSDKNECDYYGNLTWNEKKKIKNYEDKREWLKEEQLFWYSIDSLTQKIEFYNPLVDEGFEKDKNWKPIINQQDLIENFSDEK